MALYSLNASWINRKRFPFGTASAHIGYVCRESAAVVVLAARMPSDPAAAQKWIDAEERGDRSNARVITKIMAALPVELDAEQHIALARRFAGEVTRGRAPYLAAIHRPGPHGDRRNHHIHLVVRDRDPETGRTCCGMSDCRSVARIREAWERLANAALEEASRSARIDRRTLAAQGILDRLPGIHVGPAGTARMRDGRGSARWDLGQQIALYDGLRRGVREIEDEVRGLRSAIADATRSGVDGDALFGDRPDAATRWSEPGDRVGSAPSIVGEDGFGPGRAAPTGGHPAAAAPSPAASPAGRDGSLASVRDDVADALPYRASTREQNDTDVPRDAGETRIEEAHAERDDGRGAAADPAGTGTLDDADRDRFGARSGGAGAPGAGREDPIRSVFGGAARADEADARDGGTRPAAADAGPGNRAGQAARDAPIAAENRVTDVVPGASAGAAASQRPTVAETVPPLASVTSAIGPGLESVPPGPAPAATVPTGTGERRTTRDREPRSESAGPSNRDLVRAEVERRHAASKLADPKPALELKHVIIKSNWSVGAVANPSPSAPETRAFMSQPKAPVAAVDPPPSPAPKQNGSGTGTAPHGVVEADRPGIVSPWSAGSADGTAGQVVGSSSPNTAFGSFSIPPARDVESPTSPAPSREPPLTTSVPPLPSPAAPAPLAIGLTGPTAGTGPSQSPSSLSLPPASTVMGADGAPFDSADTNVGIEEFEEFAEIEEIEEFKRMMAVYDYDAQEVTGADLGLLPLTDFELDMLASLKPAIAGPDAPATPAEVPEQAKAGPVASLLSKVSATVGKVRGGFNRSNGGPADPPSTLSPAERPATSAVSRDPRAPWLAAVHRLSRESDDRNWHAHVAIHDRDPATGRTVAGLSDKGTLEHLRVVWERLVNERLRDIGSEVRVDHRTLREQGLDRVKPIHRGPAITALERRGVRTVVGAIADSTTEIDTACASQARAQAELEQLDLELRLAKVSADLEYARRDLEDLAMEAFFADRQQEEIEASLAKQQELKNIEASLAEQRENEAIEAYMAEQAQLEMLELTPVRLPERVKTVTQAVPTPIRETANPMLELVLETAKSAVTQHRGDVENIAKPVPEAVKSISEPIRETAKPMLEPAPVRHLDHGEMFVDRGEMFAKQTVPQHLEPANVTPASVLDPKPKPVHKPAAWSPMNIDDVRKPVVGSMICMTCNPEEFHFNKRLFDEVVDVLGLSIYTKTNNWLKELIDLRKSEAIDAAIAIGRSLTSSLRNSDGKIEIQKLNDAMSLVIKTHGLSFKSMDDISPHRRPLFGLLALTRQRFGEQPRAAGRIADLKRVAGVKAEPFDDWFQERIRRSTEGPEAEKAKADVENIIGWADPLRKTGRPDLVEFDQWKVRDAIEALAPGEKLRPIDADPNARKHQPQESGKGITD